jgi:uncharacterized protein with HEPN domain
MGIEDILETISAIEKYTTGMDLEKGEHYPFITAPQSATRHPSTCS